MAVHNPRNDNPRPDPTVPGSTVMANGRFAIPHGVVDGKPVLGGLQNAVVEGKDRSPEEEKKIVENYNAKRDELKKSQAKAFDQKNGETKVEEEDPKKPVIQKNEEKK